MPPSAGDFNSFAYKKAYVFCHDGKIFEYSAKEKINVSIYNAYITKYIPQGYSDFEAQ